MKAELDGEHKDNNLYWFRPLGLGRLNTTKEF
jgi:hypothetical protein